MARASAIGVVLAGLALAPSAQAEITSVFTDTPTPVACEVLTDADAGIRFCGSRDTDPGDPGNEPDRTTVKTFDGIPVDVNVAFPPASGDDDNYPLVGIYHGYAGSKLGLGSMRRWLSQGYAVFSMSTRGFGESCGSFASRGADPGGCADGYVRLMDSRYEVRDAQDFIGLLVDEGLVDPGKIGATGGSYGGGMSMALAALKDRQMMPDGSLVAWESPDDTPLEIAGAAPEIPWTDLSYSLVPNGSALDYVADASYFSGVKRLGVPKKAYIETLYVGGNLAGFYSDQDPDANLPGWRNEFNTGGPFDDSAIARYAQEELSTHHSSYGIEDSEAPAPLMITSGWTDDLFPANEATRYYNRTRSNHPGTPIALNFADYGHPRGQIAGAGGAKIATINAINSAEDAWLAYYVKGDGAEPADQVQALTQTCPSSAAPGGPFTAPTYPELAPGEVVVDSPGEQEIAADGTLFGNEFGGAPAFPGGAVPTAVACKRTDATDNPATANYRSAAVPAGGYTLMGSPTVVAEFALPGNNSQVAARLLDVAPDGQQTLVARGLWRPKVTGSKFSRQVFQLNPNGYQFEAGHVVKLELAPHDFPYGMESNGQKKVQVRNLELRLPTLEAPGALGGLVQEPARKVLRRALQLAPGFDQGAPRTRITDKPAKRSGKRDVSFAFSSSDVGSTFECKLDDEPAFSPCTSPQDYSLAPGRHHFEVQATDPDTNVDPTPAAWDFKIKK
ncbi:MAG: CocE/NonD family hydrolase [bacterium]